LFSPYESGNSLVVTRSGLIFAKCRAKNVSKMGDGDAIFYQQKALAHNSQQPEAMLSEAECQL
jgi:hypothetical protein